MKHLYLIVDTPSLNVQLFQIVTPGKLLPLPLLALLVLAPLLLPSPTDLSTDIT